MLLLDLFISVLTLLAFSTFSSDIAILADS